MSAWPFRRFLAIGVVVALSLLAMEWKRSRDKPALSRSSVENREILRRLDLVVNGTDKTNPEAVPPSPIDPD